MAALIRAAVEPNKLRSPDRILRMSLPKEARGPDGEPLRHLSWGALTVLGPRQLTGRRQVMKSYVESFGYQFNPVDFAIRSTPAVCIGMIVFITLYDVFW